jgi:hypothetical protein
MTVHSNLIYNYDPYPYLLEKDHLSNHNLSNNNKYPDPVVRNSSRTLNFQVDLNIYNTKQLALIYLNTVL